MYNRYIPQGDGSYRRSPVRSDPQQNNTAPPPPPSQHQPICEEQPPAPPPIPAAPLPPKPRNDSAGSFLRGLLPRDLDTGDLLIIVLLLLLAGDSQDDKNNALLTLALYLFM